MIVPGSREDVAADPPGGQRSGDDGQESDGLQIGVDGEGDPGRGEERIEPMCFCISLFHDHGGPLLLLKHSDRGGRWFRTGRQLAEDVCSAAKNRIHAADETIE